jgi:hypothetical protein
MKIAKVWKINRDYGPPPTQKKVNFRQKSRNGDKCMGRQPKVYSFRTSMTFNLIYHFWPKFLMISVEKYAFFIENRKWFSFFLNLQFFYFATQNSRRSFILYIWFDFYLKEREKMESLIDSLF